MIIENRDGLTILYAEGTNKITDQRRTFFSDLIYLGKNASVDNYEEVCRDIWRNFIQDNRFIENEVSQLQENNVILEDILLDTDYRLMLVEMEKHWGNE